MRNEKLWKFLVSRPKTTYYFFRDLPSVVARVSLKSGAV